MKGDGDKLARGAVRASYGPIRVSDEKWAAMWDEEKTTKKTKRKAKRKPESKS
jgi:hypothetical protein